MQSTLNEKTKKYEGIHFKKINNEIKTTTLHLLTTSNFADGLNTRNANMNRNFKTGLLSI